jgi:hypothetical protein
MTTSAIIIDLNIESNFKSRHRYVLQGLDVDRWLDSIYTATTIDQVLKIAPERAHNQPGLWRIVKSK